jgi:hypothetical protein
MVVMIAKLMTFVIERAAEPVSNRLEESASRSPTFRRTCHRLANWYQAIDYRRQMRRAAFETQQAGGDWDDDFSPGKATGVPPEYLEPPPPLEEADATQKGCEILGEGIVLSIGFALLAHQVVSDRKSEAEQEEKMVAHETKIRELLAAQSALTGRISQLQGQVGALQTEMQRSREPARPAGRPEEADAVSTSGWVRWWR